MRIKKITALFIGLIFIIVVGYDLIVAHKYGNPATVSYWFWTQSRAMPLIPFAAGVICGHIFWQVKDWEK